MSPSRRTSQSFTKVESELALTVRPLSGFKEKPARVKSAKVCQFFEGFKSKNIRFSDFSRWFEGKSYVRSKFGVSSTSRSGLEFRIPYQSITPFPTNDFSQIRASSNGSPAIGLQRKACKSEKCESLPIFLRGLKVKISGFQTFPGGLKVKATCVQNLVFPALLEITPFPTNDFSQIRASSNGSPAIGLQRKACKSEKCESLPIFLRGLKVKISGFQTFPGGLKIRASSNGSPAIGLQRKACKSEKCESLPIFLRGLKVKISGFQTFAGGLKVKATCVQNLVFPALLESKNPLDLFCRSLHSRLTIFSQIRASSNGSPAIGLQRKACKSEKCESLPIF
ncbi:hypothetical protein J6590_046018 [Homalodisca vitripennis]|nr:hypothetical protein J6590_046018 [Homalodisca vitripennis]